jgi:hypothetical protein
MAKKHMKKCLPFLAIKEMEINTTLRFYLTPELPTSRTATPQMLARMQEKRNPHTLLVGMQASTTTLDNNMEAS